MRRSIIKFWNLELFEQRESAMVDVRIDRIGFAKELEDHFTEPLRQAVKKSHEAGVRLEADFFTGLVEQPAPKSTVAAEDWFKLFKDGKIDRVQFIEGISVSVAVARRVLDEKTFEKVVTTPSEPASKVLYVRRKKSIQVQLVDAVRGLNESILDDARQQALKLAA